MALIGIGLDLVDVDRFARVLARRPGIADRLFTPAERASAADLPRRLAARFAAKEAALKSVADGLGAARLRDIEVVRASSGAPRLELRGSARDWARARGVDQFGVTISHSDATAAAVVIALGPGADV